MSIFQPGVNLTPTQRATLKMLKGSIIAVLISGMDASAQYLGSNGNLATVRWSQVGFVALIAILVALGHALDKYISARGDAPLGAVVDGSIQGIAADLSKGLETPATAPQVVIQTSAEPAPTGGYSMVQGVTSTVAQNPQPIVLTRGNTPPATTAPTALVPDQMAEAGPSQTPA